MEDAAPNEKIQGTGDNRLLFYYREPEHIMNSSS